MLEIKEQLPVIFTEKQRKQIKRLCKNAFSAFCYKTIFTNNKIQYTDVIVLDKDNNIIENILSSDLKLVSNV